MKNWVIYSTFANRDEAISVARHLTEKRLVACANIYDQITSIYRWENTVQQEPEAVLIAKTSKASVEDAIAAIKELHSYQLPCVTAWPIEKGFAPFMDWVSEETA